MALDNLKLRFGRIGVLMGGPSSERLISLKSGHAVSGALKEAGLDVVDIEIKSPDIDENIGLIRSRKIDCAFLALHGRFGEDGQIQRILHKVKVPFTCSGVKASRLAMDKEASRRIFAKAGLLVPRYKAFRKKQCRQASLYEFGFGFPLVVKPVSHGSSIGLSIISRHSQLAQAVELAFSFDDRIIVEEYIQGRELTVGILHKEPLPVIEIIPSGKFFDFRAKYQPGFTEYVVPARLSRTLASRVQKVGLAAHNLLGCHGCSRSDLILKGSQAYILEVNTIPGLTSTSLLPKAAGSVGISFTHLCLKLIELAYEKNRR